MRLRCWRCGCYVHGSETGCSWDSYNLCHVSDNEQRVQPCKHCLKKAKRDIILAVRALMLQKGMLRR